MGDWTGRKIKSRVVDQNLTYKPRILKLSGDQKSVMGINEEWKGQTGERIQAYALNELLKRSILKSRRNRRD